MNGRPWLQVTGPVPRCLIPAGCAVVAGVLLRFTLLGAEPLRGDEGFTFLAATEPGRFLTRVAGDSHPLTYYGICRLLAPLISTSDWMFRFPSAAASSAALLLWPLALRRLGLGRDLVRWSTLLFAVLPVNIFYAQEARAYAFTQLAGAACLCFYAPFTLPVSFRRWIGLVAAVALSAHLDILGLVVPCTLLVHALWIRRGDRIGRVLSAAVLSGMLIASPYYAWRVSLLAGGATLHAGLGEPARVRVLTERLVELSPLADLEGALPMPRAPKIVLAALVIVASLVAARHAPNAWCSSDLCSLFWLLFLVGPTGVTIATEATNSGAMALRYLLASTFGLVPLLTLGALVLSNRLRWIPWALLLLLPLGFTTAMLLHFSSPADDWRSLYRALSGQIQQGDGFVRVMTQNWDGWSLGRLYAYAWQTGRPIPSDDMLELRLAPGLLRNASIENPGEWVSEVERTAAIRFLDRHARTRVWVISYPSEGSVDLRPRFQPTALVEGGGVRATGWTLAGEQEAPPAPSAASAPIETPR